jgi:general secretion pathway protein C
MAGRLKNWLGAGALYLLLDLALIAALAVSLAYWTWAVFTPRSIGASALASDSRRHDVAPIIARHIFGAAPLGAAGPAARGSALRLVGVLAPRGEAGGRAIFVLESGKSRTAAVGESISPGLVLEEVHPDHVRLSRNGAMEQLRLERRRDAGR